MKAAVVFAKGSIPQYADFGEPEVQENEILISVKAASIKISTEPEQVEIIIQQKIRNTSQRLSEQTAQDIWKTEVKSIFQQKGTVSEKAVADKR